jgi:hypothetical protein
MRLLRDFFPLAAAVLAPIVGATALTYRMLPHEKACFFADVQQKGAKVAFYFAVS